LSLSFSFPFFFHVVLRVGDGAPVPLKNEVVELVVVHRSRAKK
jgi:hypothetical protein